MSKMAMRYGNVEDLPNPAKCLDLVDSDEIEDGSTVNLEFDDGGMYLLCTSEFNASTGAYRGHRIIVIQAPQESLFGTTAVKRGNIYTSSDSGVSISYNDDSTVTLARSSATYAFRYALYKVL